MACAEEISAVCDAQEYLAAELISWLTLREFWFFLQAHEANAVASGGQTSYVYESSVDRISANVFRQNPPAC
jgi:hypothetical protein